MPDEPFRTVSQRRRPRQTAARPPEIGRGGGTLGNEEPSPPASSAHRADAAGTWRERLGTRIGDPDLASIDLGIVGVLILSAVLLTLYAYFGEADFYRANLAAWVNATFHVGAGANQHMLAFWYQSAHAVAWRILVPLAWIVFVLRDSARHYGYRMPQRGHRAIYLYLYLLMLPVLAAVSFLPSFRVMYPIYGDAFGSVDVLVPYLLAYGLRFAAVEAFFRGFLLFALYRRFGYHAIAIMAVPYCMIHFGKPFFESLGSIVAALLLGYLALRGRSWIPGALLHWGIAITMDLLGLWQRVTNP